MFMKTVRKFLKRNKIISKTNSSDFLSGFKPFYDLDFPSLYIHENFLKNF